jgi:hypothetical protein
MIEPLMNPVTYSDGFETSAGSRYVSCFDDCEPSPDERGDSLLTG